MTDHLKAAYEAIDRAEVQSKHMHLRDDCIVCECFRSTKDALDRAVEDSFKRGRTFIGRMERTMFEERIAALEGRIELLVRTVQRREALLHTLERACRSLIRETEARRGSADYELDAEIARVRALLAAKEVA